MLRCRPNGAAGSAMIALRAIARIVSMCFATNACVSSHAVPARTMPKASAMLTKFETMHTASATCSPGERNQATEPFRAHLRRADDTGFMVFLDEGVDARCLPRAALLGATSRRHRRRRRAFTADRWAWLDATGRPRRVTLVRR